MKGKEAVRESPGIVLETKRITAFHSQTNPLYKVLSPLPRPAHTLFLTLQPPSQSLLLRIFFSLLSSSFLLVSPQHAPLLLALLMPFSPLDKIMPSEAIPQSCTCLAFHSGTQ